MYQDGAASSHNEDGVFLHWPRRSWRGSFLFWLLAPFGMAILPDQQEPASDV
jgi:hypothetical protein